jgi:hypothetical protein
MLSGEATNTNLWFDQSGLEPMIYYTQGKHVDHYTTDAFKSNLNIFIYHGKFE